MKFFTSSSSSSSDSKTGRPNVKNLPSFKKQLLIDKKDFENQAADETSQPSLPLAKIEQVAEHYDDSFLRKELKLDDGVTVKFPTTPPHIYIYYRLSEFSAPPSQEDLTALQNALKQKGIRCDIESDNGELMRILMFDTPQKRRQALGLIEEISREKSPRPR